MTPTGIPRLLLVTDRLATGDDALVDTIRIALDAGLPAVQLRAKDLPGRMVLALAERLRTATHTRGAQLWINDRVDVALAVGADAIHLGTESLPVDVVRSMVPSTMLVTRAIHSTTEVTTTSADVLLFGPVWETPSKRPFGPPQGLERLRDVIGLSRAPVIAIGGVDAPRARAALEAGASGVAVIRAILAAPDPAAATRGLLEAGPP